MSFPAGGAPAGLQWTLTYAAGNVAAIGAVASASVTAAGKAITCFSTPVSYTCALSGTNDAVIGNGVVAVINVTMASTAVTTPVGLANMAGAAAAGSSIPITGTGGTITLPPPPAQLPALTGLSCNATSLGSGTSSICTAALNLPAPAGGVTVGLSSSTGALSVPGSVTVAAGTASTTFTAIAGTIASNVTAVVTASYNGGSQTTSILLVSTVVSLVSCTPSSLISGGTSACAVTLSQAAASGGVTVALSSNTAALAVPATVNVASGALSAGFTATAGTISTSQMAVVTASLYGSSQREFVTLVPTTAATASVSVLSCTPDRNNVGGLDCTVSLAQVAPANGVAAALRANTSRVQLPAQVQVPAGALSVQFAASVAPSDQDAQVEITATVQGASLTTTIPVTGIRPTSLSCAPQTVQAGGSLTCTVGMNSPNVLQVASLAIGSDTTDFELPNAFTTRVGQTSLGFEVFTTPAAGHQSSTVSVQFGQTVVTTSVAVTPAGAPVLNLPGTQLAVFGKPLTFVVSAVDPGGLPLTLSAANLPPGASFDDSSGGFLWTPQEPARRIYSTNESSQLERRAVTFAAIDTNGVSASGSVVIEAGPGLPVITDLRNAGSQQSQTVPSKVRVGFQPTSLRCSPGSVASLLGRWLSARTEATADPTGSSTLLAGSQVMVNDNPAALVYASATRVDFVCPQTAPGGELRISVQSGGAVSNVVHANQDATFGLLSTDGSGQGQGMAMFSGTSVLVAPRSYLSNGQPAEPGDAISILATGIGLETSASLVRVSIGGASVAADLVQASPSMAGVYRIEVTVPASVVPGDAVPVVVQVPDSSGKTFTGNTVTIAVEAP
ncbi:MAG TPA: hypothetical protein VGF03_06835 [Bryobacteraceae bacterium]